MNQLRPITIVGGGLAGLSLGIALRQQSIPTALHEAGSYPRHRVCGEFLSGAGQHALNQLGLLSACSQAGGRWAQTIRFATDRRLGTRHTLPQPALCLSRFQLDQLLADAFINAGGDLRVHSRQLGDDHQAGFVFATGRRPSAAVGGWRWWGVKCHARNVRLDADLELHVGADAYVGLCRLADDVVNVCGLFRRKQDDARPEGEPIDWLRGPTDSLRSTRLAQAEWIPESLCAVAGLDLRRHRANGDATIRLGDALSMIPPFTGNGMSLALESGAAAVQPLAAYARGETSWDIARRRVAASLNDLVGARLRWAAMLQRLLFAPAIPSLWLRLTDSGGGLFRLAFALTRGG